ncbi:MAG: DivIVA domain-containing protein [Cytophagaceae bacterium]|jgi:cell division initiation protein|nr:DivIVA domain-containing protein [Cytophagaceae bacterium]
MITPLEIRKKEFEKAFRGYEKEEVDAFLQSLSKEWERTLDENKELSKRLDHAEKELQRMRDMEATLYKTLKTAEETSSGMMEQAHRTAELHVREAQMNAEALLSEARSKARAMVEDAEIEVKNIIDDLQSDVRNIEREYNYIDNQKENLLEELKSFVKETIDKVDKYHGRTSRTTFDLKLKEIRNLNNPNPVKALEITNAENLAEEKRNEMRIHFEKPVHTIKPSEEEETPPPTKEDKSNEGSFFDSI